MFEWQSGVRKNLVFLVIAYIPGLFGLFGIWLPALSLILTTVTIVSFYSEYEPLQMLTAGEKRPGRFLLHKILLHVGCFALLLLPQLAMALAGGELPLYSVGYFFAALNLLVFSILLKYWQYRPAAFSGPHQLLTTMACLVSVILPVAVVILAANIFLAIGAFRNLKPFLHDHN